MGLNITILSPEQRKQRAASAHLTELQANQQRMVSAQSLLTNVWTQGKMAGLPDEQIIQGVLADPALRKHAIAAFGGAAPRTVAPGSGPGGVPTDQEVAQQFAARSGPTGTEGDGGFSAPRVWKPPDTYKTTTAGAVIRQPGTGGQPSMVVAPPASSFTLGPGQTRYGGDGRPIAALPNKPEGPKAPSWGTVVDDNGRLAMHDFNSGPIPTGFRKASPVDEANAKSNVPMGMEQHRKRAQEIAKALARLDETGDVKASMAVMAQVMGGEKSKELVDSLIRRNDQGAARKYLLEQLEYHRAKAGDQPAAAPAEVGQRRTARNPQTGERLEWNGSAWVPISK